MDISISTLAERPELIGQVWDMPDSWDEFMDHDPIAEALFGSVAQQFRQLGVVATYGEDIARQLGKLKYIQKLLCLVLEITTL